MKLRNRLIIVGIGIILFLLITPIIVLFARGFKYDFENNQLVKTGTLVVETEPDDARIFLDDELIPDDTPSNIRFLVPGDYNVRIEKDEYQSWTKRLSIRPQFVTWANQGRDFISLFYQQPKLTNQTPIAYASVSKDRTRIAYVTENELREIKINNQSDDRSASVNQTPINLNLPLVWSEAIQIFQNPAQLPQADKIESNGQLTVALIDQNLYRVLPDGTQTLLGTGVRDFTLEDNTIWFADAGLIHRLNFSNNETTSITAIPSATEIKLIRSFNQLYIILDQVLYIVNDELEQIYAPVTFAYFDANSPRLVYGNNNEILIYRPETQRSELILRSIAPLSPAVLNWETGYVLFRNDHKIKAIELDGRDHRNIYTLLELDELFLDFLVSKNGQWLYVINQDSVDRYQIR